MECSSKPFSTQMEVTCLLGNASPGLHQRKCLFFFSLLCLFSFLPMLLEEICWTHTNAGPCELGSSWGCSVNGYNSGSQAADGVRRERLSCKIAKRGWERWKKCRGDTEEEAEVRERVSVSNVTNMRSRGVCSLHPSTHNVCVHILKHGLLKYSFVALRV